MKYERSGMSSLAGDKPMALAKRRDRMITQLVSVAAAVVVLFAFWRQQQGRWQSYERGYLACNFAGTFVLTIVAWIGSQWGFVLIEAIWCLVSLRGLVRRP